MLKEILKCCPVALIVTIVMTGCVSGNEEVAEVKEGTLSEVTETMTENTSSKATETQNETELSEPENDVNTGNARITFSVREYIGDNIAEIPYIEYDGDINPEIESINRSVNQGIRQIYDDFMSTERDFNWIEIRSYPFTSDDYLQVVVTYCEYPIYGTDGNMFSINYDRKAKKALVVSDALNELGMTQSDIEAEIQSVFEPEIPSMYIGETMITGFLKDKDTNDITLLLELMIENPEADSGWKYFYSYTPNLNVLSPLDKTQLFSPEETDDI